MHTLVYYLVSRGWKHLVLLCLGLVLLAGAGQVLLPWYIYNNGTAAEASVEAFWDTYQLVDNEPLYGLILEVRPLEGQPFLVERSCRYTPQSARIFRQGAGVSVHYLPRLPQRVVMVSAGCDREFASLWLLSLGVVSVILLSYITPSLYRQFVPSFLTGLPFGGRPALATVLNVQDSGDEIDDQPRLEVLLYLEPSVGEPLDVQTAVVIPRKSLAGLFPGAELQVHFDPRRPKRLRVDAYDTGVTPENIQPRLKKLEQLQAAGVILPEEYQRLRRNLRDRI
jgi:hypothetical protein